MADEQRDGEREDMFLLSPTDDQRKSNDERRAAWWYIDRSVLANKIFYFTNAGLGGCLGPFIPIYLKQHGLRANYVGIITALSPFANLLGNLAVGPLADKFNIHKFLLLLCAVAANASYCGLAFVPPADMITQCNESAVLVDMYGKECTQAIPYSGTIDYSASSPMYTQMPLVTNESLHMWLMGNHSHCQNVTTTDIKHLQENTTWLYDNTGLLRVFLSVLLIMFIGDLFGGPQQALADASTSTVLVGNDLVDGYGAQRAWASIGEGIAAILVGILINSTRFERLICLVPLFFSQYYEYVIIFAPLSVVSCIAAAFMKFEKGTVKRGAEANNNESEMKEEKTDKVQQEANKSPVSAVFKLFLTLHYASWFMILLTFGISNGVTLGYLNWHLENLGADQLLIGLTRVVMCFTSFVVFYLAKFAIQRFSQMPVTCAAFITIILRNVFYGLLTNPWLVLPIEVLHGISFPSMWVCLISYFCAAVPTSSLVTMLGIIHGVYYGLGMALGHLIGGQMVDSIGAPFTFFVFAVAYTVILIVFVVVQKISEPPPRITDEISHGNKQ